jgi:type VI secretion system secreted protein VgrG
MLSQGPITLEPPPNAKSLIFRSMTAQEELGRLFKYEIDLLNQDSNLKPADVLGQLMTVHIELRHGDVRHFNGYVTDMSLKGTLGAHALYTFTVRPWLWLLTRTNNCRIFQKMTVPDIIKQVFRDHGLTDFEEALSGTYAANDFIVQYRETDFNFVSRLMEQVGIYYFFKHTESTHSLVLSDSYSAHATVSGYESIPYYPPDEHRGHDTDFVDRWESSHQIEPGAYALTDFDFERPKASLLAKLALPNDHAKADFEVFDYPGAYTEVKNGEDYVRVRLEELHVAHAQAHGRSNARGLAVGSLFELTDHPIEAQNAEYLVVTARHELRTHDQTSGAELPDEDVYRCTFSTIESSRPFRPARTTHKPLVNGPQTAIVVGKGGEEIWTDNFGRVKVKFHWDRFAKGDESSSCWVRVAQAWAGSGWGSIHIPRMGQEVIVEFLEGDPDRPIITGRVYNGDNAVPYGLPGNQTQSGIKSRSSKGGSAGNFNELRFEDKKGSEQVYFQAEKNLDTLVKASETHSVGSDRTISVGNDETHTVTNNRSKTVQVDETVVIGANRTETVGADETITVMANRTETVAASETINIGTTRDTTVIAADSLKVGGAQTVMVGAAQSVTVGGVRTVQVVGAENISVGAIRSVGVKGNQSISVGANETVEVKGQRTQSVGKDDTLKVAKNFVVNAGDQITLKTGDASIMMKKNGDIVIKGKNIQVQGSGKVNVKASSDVVIKGSKIGQN